MRHLLLALLLLGVAGAARADEMLTATASSEKQPAAQAADDKFNTRWESKKEDEKAWIMFEFYGDRALKDLVIHWENAAARKYTVEVQSGDSGWKEVASVDNGSSNDSRYIDFGRELTVRKLRINCLEKATKWGYSIYEVNFSPDKVDGIETGVMHENITCKANPDQSYSLYIPKSYGRGGKKYPVVYGFSPDARGTDPVRLLTDSAEKNGFIVMGSNNARNGEWAPIREAIIAVVEDSKARFRVDARKCAAVGFSGGARMGFYAAAMYPGMITGVVPCCAGFPGNDYVVPPSLKVFGLSGTSDFNNAEVRKVVSSLGWPVDSNVRFEEFNGGHGWPPKEKLEEAMDWLFSK
jgi:dienelactone hydrolase